MSVWIVLGWEESYGNWEVLSVLFDAAAVEAKVKELFGKTRTTPKSRWNVGTETMRTVLTQVSMITNCIGGMTM